MREEEQKEVKKHIFYPIVYYTGKKKKF